MYRIFLYKNNVPVRSLQVSQLSRKLAHQAISPLGFGLSSVAIRVLKRFFQTNKSVILSLLTIRNELLDTSLLDYLFTITNVDFAGRRSC